MTATNHALTGALIGLTIANPVLAVPLAFISHFALDSIPHFGGDLDELRWLRSKAFKTILIIEPIVCFTIVALLFQYRPEHWFLAAITAFVATSPDLFWIKRFISANRKGRLPTISNVFWDFHHKIQWFQRPIGLVVESVWFMSFAYLFWNLL